MININEYLINKNTKEKNSNVPDPYFNIVNMTEITGYKHWKQFIHDLYFDGLCRLKYISWFGHMFDRDKFYDRKLYTIYKFDQPEAYLHIKACIPNDNSLRYFIYLSRHIGDRELTEQEKIKYQKNNKNFIFGINPSITNRKDIPGEFAKKLYEMTKERIKPI